MQLPTIVLDMLNKRSQNRYNIDHIYRYLYNPQWYMDECKQLNVTIESKHIGRINDIISVLRYERYKWTKSDGIIVYKINDKLSESIWKDMILQKVIYRMLYTIYEPRFLECSHGLRANKKMGIHTALARVAQKGTSSQWFIEGNVIDIINNLSSNILLSIISKTIKDGRFIELLRKMLKCYPFGYNFQQNTTYSGTIIGSKLSNLFLNIYLNELDQFVEDRYTQKYNVLNHRPTSKEYNKCSHLIDLNEKHLDKITNEEDRRHIIDEIKRLRKYRRTILSKVNIEDTSYRRFCYTRYANSWFITFTGTLDEAKEIKSSIGDFIENALSLKYDESKSRIIYAYTKQNIGSFLNFNLLVQRSNTRITNGARSINGKIAFFIPREVLLKYIKRYNDSSFTSFINNTVSYTIEYYQHIYKDICLYYQYARNCGKMLSYLKYVMEQSLVNIICMKYKLSRPKVYKKYSRTVNVGNRLYKVLYTTKDDGTSIYFGAIPLNRKLPTGLTYINDRRYYIL